MAIAIEDIKGSLMALIGIMGFRICFIRKRPGASRGSGCGRMSGVGTAWGFAMIPDNQDIGGSIAIGELDKIFAIGSAVDIVHSIAALIEIPILVKPVGTLEDFLVSLKILPKYAGGVTTIIVGIIRIWISTCFDG